MTLRPILPLFLLLCSLVAIPFAGEAFGTLSDIRYKTKSSDGNRLASLFVGSRLLRGSEVKGRITFTFDDGPDHRTTPILLDQLDRYDIKGTFFVNGSRFHSRTAGGEENSAVLRDLYRRGHFIGNHTFSHQDITTLDDSGWRAEVDQVNAQVTAITGTGVHLFRPPFGRSNAATLSRLTAQGYSVVMWNMDPLDWNATTARQLVDRTKEVVESNPDGGIFLLHDTNRNTAEAFPLIMEYLEERNAVLRAQGRGTLEVTGIDQFFVSHAQSRK